MVFLANLFTSPLVSGEGVKGTTEEGRNMKKRAFALVLVIVLLATALVGCRSNGTETSGDDGDTILFGGTLAMTGDNAPFDQMAIRGMEVAIDKVNADGGINGKKIEWKNLDCKSDPAVSAEVAKQLLDEGAAVIITSSDYDMGGPAAKVATAAGKVGINSSASDPGYGSKKLGPYAFTLSMWNTTMGAAAAETAFKDDGNKSTWLITDPFISYTESLTRYFKESFTGQGGTVLAEDTVVHEKADTAALMTRWNSFATKPDCIWVSGYPDTLGPIIKEFRASGVDVPIYGGDVYEDPELWKVWGPEYSTNITYAGHAFLSEEAVPGYPEYNVLYEKKYGEPVDAPWSMGGWDVIMVLAEAMGETKSTDGATVSKYMEEHRFECLTGEVGWSSAEDGHEPDKAACMVTLDKGEAKFLGWVKPSVLPQP